MSADARLLNFRQYVEIIAPEIKRLIDARPHRLVPPIDKNDELNIYALAIYRHKVARKRMLAEGRIAQI